MLASTLAIAVLLAAFVVYTLAAYRPSRRERSASLPGDAKIARPMFVTTHAVTIRAPPSRLWPWIIQMGAGRAGWYSYDMIDNGGQPSATVLLSQYQRIAQGDLLPAVPGATDAFVVIAVDAPRDLVLGVPLDSSGSLRVTWEFVLEAAADGRTRLLVRGRVAATWLSAPPQRDVARAPFLIERVYGLMAHLPIPVLAVVAGFGHRVMQNAQLRGLKHRAEILG